VAWEYGGGIQQQEDNSRNNSSNLSEGKMLPSICCVVLKLELELELELGLQVVLRLEWIVCSPVMAILAHFGHQDARSAPCELLKPPHRRLHFCHLNVCLKASSWDNNRQAGITDKRQR
jgi:hypothetical protein